MSDLATREEEILLTLRSFIMAPIGLIISLVVLILVLRILCNKSKQDNPDQDGREKNIYFWYADYSTLVVLLGSVVYYFMHIFVCNDAAISWNYTNSGMFSIQTINSCAYFIGKIAYYLSFTLHLQGIL